jgi:hypothetical protein
MTTKQFYACAVFFIICYSANAESDETEYDKTEKPALVDDLTDRRTVDAFIRTTIGQNQNASDKALNAIVNLGIGGGSGYGWELIPYIFSPGFYIEIGVNAITLLANLGRDEDDDSGGVLLNSGFYAQNQFRWGIVDMAPFYGVTATFGGFSNDSGSNLIGYMGLAAGLRVSIKSFGLEYAFYSPLVGKYPAYNALSHRVSVMYHFR